jgi:hypothetical protein
LRPSTNTRLPTSSGLSPSGVRDVGVATDLHLRPGNREEFSRLASDQAKNILDYLDAGSGSQQLLFWRRHAGDPELRKLLGRIHTAIGNAQRLDTASTEGLGAKGRDRICELLATDPRTLDVDGALEIIDNLDQFLIEHGDEYFLHSLLAAEFARDKIETTATTWSAVHGKPPPTEEIHLVYSGQPFDDARLTAVRHQLAALYRTRSIIYDLHRARQAMKGQHLWLLAPVLLALLVAFAGTILVAGGSPSSIALAAVAGALGAALSGTFKLRDHITNINDLRAFAPSVVVQPLIGATAGLLLLVVLSSKLITVNWGGPDWATRGVIEFVAGFSEPFFLGIIGKVAAIGESRPDGEKGSGQNSKT